MLAQLTSAAVLGIDAYLVEIEVDISSGLPGTVIVGLPDAGIKQSRDRIKSALKNSQFQFPNRKITINLAPADIKKEGPRFDLPIALGILAASGEIGRERLKSFVILGELALDGGLRSVKGVLPIALIAARKKQALILPDNNAAEAAVVKRLKVYPVKSLPQVVRFLKGDEEIKPKKVNAQNLFKKYSCYSIDFSDIKGQLFARRALEVAVAGGHNILFIGPPGAGKTMLARRLPTILPDISLEEALETTKIHSIMGLVPENQALIATRPFRSPHHISSDAGLIGGGSPPQPGEVSLAHNGVLFLDELPEFSRSVLEVLRQPLEDGRVTISRAAHSLTYPARFMLVASMNPCPCGYYTHPKRECRCNPAQIQRYLGKISGPLLDRIDIHIDVPALSRQELQGLKEGESSEVIRKRVNRARKIQERRLRKDKLFSNSRMETRHLKKHCPLSDEVRNLLDLAINELGISARAYDKILKVSRTIADLAESGEILAEHVSEAIQYRSLDREVWG